MICESCGIALRGREIECQSEVVYSDCSDSDNHLSSCGALISHFCCSGTVCHVLARFTMAAASISPYPNEWLTIRPTPLWPHVGSSRLLGLAVRTTERGTKDTELITKPSRNLLPSSFPTHQYAVNRAMSAADSPPEREPQFLLPAVPTLTCPNARQCKRDASPS